MILRPLQVVGWHDGGGQLDKLVGHSPGSARSCSWDGMNAEDRCKHFVWAVRGHFFCNIIKGEKEIQKSCKGCAQRKKPACAIVFIVCELRIVLSFHTKKPD
ncbi:hypothetical protein VPH35_132024 [Triticum aestivum]